MDQGARLEGRRSPSGSSAASSTSRENCLDRHLGTAAAQQGRASSGKANPGEQARAHLPAASPRSLPLRQRPQAQRHARRATACIIYMPMIPEAAIAMLACARIGAVHSRRLRRLQRASRIKDRVARLRRKHRHHRGRRLSARRRSSRSRKTSMTRCQERQTHRASSASSSSAARQRHPHRGGPRRLVAPRSWNTWAPIAPPKPLDSEAPALHPLHQRLDRQTQGHPAHHRRLPARR